MPRASQKSQFIDAIYLDAALNIMELDYDDDDEAEDIEFDCLTHIAEVLIFKSTSYFTLSPSPITRRNS